MITIRYADLPEGSHVQAVARGKRTVIYLRPGLTPEQRRHGLRRARQSGRMGHGPGLPATGVALAVAGDAVRGTLRRLAAAVSGHPLGSLLLAAGLAGAVLSYVLLVTVSIRFIGPPAGRDPVQGARLAAPPGLGSAPGRAAPGQFAAMPSSAPGGLGGPGWPGGRGWPDGPRVTGRVPSPRVRRSGRPTPVPSGTTDPAPTPDGTSAVPSPPASPPPSGSPVPAPSPQPAPGHGGWCPLNICL
jgi:hypothetical protein